MPQSLHRLGLRIAWQLMRPYWFVVRPRTRGVKCVVVCGERFVLVRHTYGRREVWDLPGGGIKRGESPVDAARREVREELGVDLDDWRTLGLTKRPVQHKRNLLYGCAATAPALSIAIDGIEIAEAEWFGRDSLPTVVTPWVGEFADAAFGTGNTRTRVPPQ